MTLYEHKVLNKDKYFRTFKGLPVRIKEKFCMPEMFSTINVYGFSSLELLTAVNTSSALQRNVMFSLC